MGRTAEGGYRADEERAWPAGNGGTEGQVEQIPRAGDEWLERRQRNVEVDAPS